MLLQLRSPLASTFVCCAFSTLVPAVAAAQSGPAPEPWKYTASINLYLPTIGGSSSFPTEGSPINVSAEQILNALKMTFMGTLDAHNGTWGVLNDLVYVDLGGSKSNSRDFTIGNIGLPAGTTANLDLDYKATVWTIAGEYRVSSEPSLTLDLLAGARLFDQRQRLGWSISGDIGPLPPTSRTGSAELNQRVWDGIVGVKGRYVFSADRKWAAPFYLDVGTGQSASTLQAVAGVSYGFEWGEINALWRYLKYNVKSGKAITSMDFSGPQIGAVFHW
jgi:hypothetical protein